MQVLHEGRWLSGALLATWRKPDGSWHGLVHYTDPRVALAWYHWRPATELRRSLDSPP